MSDDVFRFVVAGGVSLVAIAFVVQALVGVAFYRIARKTQERIDSIGDSVDPLLAKIGPLADKAIPVIEKAGPIFDRIAPLMEKTGQAMDQVGPVVQKIGQVAESTRVTVAAAHTAIGTANRIMEETRPQIVEVSSEVAGIVRTGREQVERVGDFLQDASDRARNRLEQIDHSVDSTVDQVAQVGDAMKRAVMRPVREVNGLAAGISAAVSTLAKRRKSSVDSATLDEEMFI